MDGGARVAPGAATESNVGIDTRMYRSRVTQDAVTEQLPTTARTSVTPWRFRRRPCARE